MNKIILKQMKNLYDLPERRLSQISSIKDNNIEKAIQMCEISKQILDNGYDINPNIYENLKLKDLKVLNKTLNEFYQKGKSRVDEEMIRSINTLKINKEEIDKPMELMSTEEKIILLSTIYEKNENEIIYILNNESPEKKIEFLNKYIDEEVFDEELFLKKQNETKIASILRELSLFETQKEKQGFLRFLKEKENEKELEPIYNKQLHDMLEDSKLSIDKQNFLKEAYFKKGLDIEKFQKSMGNEFYNCSEAQLENYVELWDKYQDNLISRDDYFYGKEIIFKEEIPQEAIEETLLPILQEDSLSQNEIEECINTSYDKDEEFFKEVTELAITAKENDYSQEEIYTLIQDSKDDSIDKIKETIELIEEAPDNSINIEKLDSISTEDIKMIQEYDLNSLDKSKSDYETDMELDFFRNKY